MSGRGTIVGACASIAGAFLAAAFVAGALHWATRPAVSQSASDDTGVASYAKEAAKAARAAAEEAKAAAAAAKASATAGSTSAVPFAEKTPAQSNAPQLATAPATAAPLAIAPSQTDSTKRPTGPAPSAPLAGAAKAAVPKIVLTPAKQLFGAAKVAAPLNARAIGGYANGCLAGGKELAIDGPAWQAMRLSRNRNWGHPKLIALLERFASEMKTKENWPGLLIGDIAQPRGGPMLTGHKSHQVGLDADIWFKPKPAETLSRAARETLEPLLLAEDKGTEVIAANWNEGFVRLVKRAASYPEVERIFVHPAIKKEFCKAAGTDRGWLLKVRPMWLHNYHFHIRMGCPAGSQGCESQKAPPKDSDGCGKEVDDWIKLVSAPPKPAPMPAPPPQPPAPEKTLVSLPVACRSVLTAGEAKDSVAVKAVADIAAANAAAKAAAIAEKETKAAKAKVKAAAKASSSDN